MDAAEAEFGAALPEAPEAPTATRGGPFGERNFRLFFFGQLISNSGTWLQNVAQGVLVLKLSGRSFMVGVTTAAMFLPVVFLALPGGHLADRFDRTRLLIWTQVLAMAATGGLAILALTGRVTVAAVVVAALLVGVQYAVSIPTMLALLPSLVPREQLGQAIGLNSITYNLARVLGPLLSTAAIAAVGFGMAFGLNSLSFLALIVALLLIHPGSSRGAGDPGGSIREAVSHAWRDRRVRTMLLGVAAVAIAMDPVVTLSPTFAQHVFERRAADAGLLVAAFGTGAIVTALALHRAFRAPASRRYRTLTASMLVYAGGLVGFALSPSFWVAFASLVVAGAGFLASSTTWTTGIQEEVSEGMRGRVMGLWTLCFLGTRPLAGLIDGGFADLLNPRAAVLVVLAPLVLVAVFGAPRLRRAT